MGRLINGINGPIHGKVGKVHGSSRNGVPYIKGPYKPRTLKVTVKELQNRKKFALAQSWLAPLVKFVREGFRGYSQRSHGFIAAKSWLLKNAIIVNGDEMSIDPALVKVSSGDLPNPKNIQVSLTETGSLQFTWDTTNDASQAKDQIMMLAYDIERRHAVYSTTGQFFNTGTDVLTLDPSYGKNFHVYAAFNAADRSRQSDSMYLGEWKIQ